MRLNYNKNRADPTVYIIESVYLCGKRTTRIVEKLGKMSELQKKYPDPIAHFQSIVDQMSKEAKTKKAAELVKLEFNPDLLIDSDRENRFFAGHLFINKIYFNLGLPQFCKIVADKKKFKFDLNQILSYIINATFITPDSKLGIFDSKDKFIDAPDFSLADLYRSLDYIEEHSDLLQTQMYQASTRLIQRDTSVLYYDCTNYYFEIDLPDIDTVDETGKVVKKGKRSYGHCKRNSRKPITSFGLFMDASGIPLAFTTFPGGQNEQKTLKPLEKQIMQDFGLARFVVCTDAGLTSFANKKFNSGGSRSYITTQHLSGMTRKQSKKKSKELSTEKQERLTEKQKIVAWALQKTGWCYREYNPELKRWIIISDIDLSLISDEEWDSKHASTIFYKDRIFKYKSDYVNEDGESTVGVLEERFVVSYCLKNAIRTRTLREGTIERAMKLIRSNRATLKATFGTAAKYIKEEAFNADGEIIDNAALSISEEAIEEDAKYDGFYCVTTNLLSEEEGDGYKIVAVTKRRWEIEESFLILQNVFRTRPIRLRTEERIDAHLIIHFMALLIYRIMEQKICKYTDEFSFYDIVECLRSMQLHKQKNEGYSPSFKRTKLVDRLSEVFGIELRTEIITHKRLHQQIKASKG